MKHIRATIRRQRQEKRLQEVAARGIKENPHGVKVYILHGGDLDTRLKQPGQQMTKRQERSMRAGSLRAAIRDKLKKEKQPPVSLKSLKRMAQEFRRRAMKRIQKKAIQ